MKISPYDNGVLVEKDGAYTVLHPWTSLGDESLESYLRDLKSGQKLPLTQRCLELLEIEKVAKLEKKLLLPQKLPPCHHLLRLGEVPGSDFEVFKFKVGNKADEELHYLNSLTENVASFAQPFRLRLDVNLKFKRENAFQFFSKLSEKILCRIDFVEDPIAGNLGDWQDFSTHFDLRCAHDFADDSFREVADVWILKPSRQNPWPLVERATREMKRIVVTSALDHPLGLAIASWEASRIYEAHPLLIDACGLSPLPKQTGYGFGLDEDLQRLPWINL